MSHDWFQQRKWEDQGFETLEDFIVGDVGSHQHLSYSLLNRTSLLLTVQSMVKFRLGWLRLAMSGLDCMPFR